MKNRLFYLINTLIFLFFVPLAFGQKTLPEEQLIGKGNPELTERNGYKLRPEAAEAFDKMKAAAAKEGIAFQVVSSYRDYAHQNRIWERKYNAYTANGLSPQDAIAKIIEYSTIPGTSRHHWGTDIDIVDSNQPANGDLLVPSKFHGNGPFCKFKAWMDEHANTYGFYLVYTQNGNRKGFNYEPWHYSYKPLSSGYLEQYKKLDVKKVLAEQKLLGNDQFSDEFITRYRDQNILDINPQLLP
ncbi:M15 family metallopeptidase [Flavimarina sp. Hel_I_48]|uniref:M15 family metallopeptidase n=1 Tax=Flavimarina sp. Hel_I_48 TaxID=1392488 RepID=UPI0004DF403F|nr:M15 family metallopeptidase [Flavimarina sp. Hel_I_48]